MNFKRGTILLFLLYLTLYGTFAFANEKFVVVDKLNRKIEITAPIKRAIFISLYELIPAFNLWDRVVGINRWAYCNTLLKNFHKLAHIPSVGTGGDINIEKIISLKPDLIITWVYKPQIISFLANKGEKVLAVYPESLKELYQDIFLIGRLFKKEKRAKDIIKNINRVFSLINSRVSKIPMEKRKRILWLWGTETTVNGGIGVQNDVIRLIGGINPAASINLKNIVVPLEKIIIWNPDVIFIWGNAKYGEKHLLSSLRWSCVKAVRDKKVFKAPPWSTWSPRLAIIALWMAKKTYPELFKDINIDRYSREFSLKVFGKPLSYTNEMDK